MCVQARARGDHEEVLSTVLHCCPAGDAKKGESGGECAHGRVHVVTMSAEEKAARMNEMVEERVEQMAMLKRLIDR